MKTRRGANSGAEVYGREAKGGALSEKGVGDGYRYRRDVDLRKEKPPMRGGYVFDRKKITVDQRGKYNQVGKSRIRKGE